MKTSGKVLFGIAFTIVVLVGGLVAACIYYVNQANKNRTALARASRWLPKNGKPEPEPELEPDNEPDEQQQPEPEKHEG